MRVDRKKFTIRRVKNSWNIRHWRISRQHVYIYISVLLGRNFRHLYSPAGNLIVSRWGLSVGLEGEVERSARFSSGKCRSVSFQFAHRRGSRLFWESCFPWPKIYEHRSTFQGRRIYARSPRRRLMAGELSVCASIAAHSSSIIRRYITRVHSPWSF